MPDWLAIKNEYVTGSMSQRALAEKHGVSQSAINSRARREGWEDARKSFSLKTTQTVAQKVSAALAASEADIAAVKSNTRLKLWHVFERTVDEITDETDSADIRRCVQNYVDLMKAEPVTETEEVESSGLLDALNAACDVWTDGDDSDCLPN